MGGLLASVQAAKGFLGRAMSTDFDETFEQALAVVAGRKAPDDLRESDALAIIRHRLALHLQRFHGSAVDYDDVVDFALDAVVDSCIAGGVDWSSNPSSYLLTLARWRAVDFLRVRLQEVSRTSSMAEVDLETIPNPLDDDAVAMRLQAGASTALVRKALGVALSAGDETAFRVAEYALDSIDSTGKMPTLRDIGTAIGLSHTGARKALGRYRSYLEAVTAER